MTEVTQSGTLTGRHHSSMSFWSRHDPVMVPHNTDHWAKLRVRSSYLADLGDPTVFKPTNRVAVGVVDLRELFKIAKECRTDHSKADFQTRMRQLQENGDGRVDPKGASVFTKVVARDLHGNIPGNYTLTRPRTSSNKCPQKSIYYERAKQGFKYWYQERPKPTSFGKYGIGSYKTVLGLGNAPRT